jgi:hypothetical protein
VLPALPQVCPGLRPNKERRLLAKSPCSQPTFDRSYALLNLDLWAEQGFQKGFLAVLEQLVELAFQQGVRPQSALSLSY